MSEGGNRISIEEQLQNEGVYVTTTVGVSMKPMLRNRRDRIVVLPVGDRTLGKGDLPLYRRPDGAYVLHRIIGVKGDHYIIRGDNTYAKEIVPHAWVLGYVSEFYRGERHVLSSSKRYRLYVTLWQLLYPLRLPVHKLRVLIGRNKRKS